VGPAPDGGVRLVLGDDELELGARAASAVWLVAARAPGGGDAAAGAGAHSAGRPDSQ
jgi:hypothetical protein